MKALTLHQPWATLVALNEKLFETRSWDTKYRGPLAIHASATWHDYAKRVALADPIASTLRNHGINHLKELPLGSVIGIVELIATYPTNLIPEDILAILGENEKAFGDWRPGRYIWQLALRTIPDFPIPATGHQKLWNWSPPMGITRYLAGLSPLDEIPHKAEFEQIDKQTESSIFITRDKDGELIKTWVGFVSKDTWFKNINGEKHTLRVFPGICFDITSIEDAQALGAKYVAVLDTNIDKVYVARIERLWEKGEKIERGHNKQWGLTYRYWSTNQPEPLQPELL